MQHWRFTRFAITGGSGFLGRRIIRRLLKDQSAERIVSISRDEVKHGELLDEFGLGGPLRVIAGDVRDAVTLSNAFRGCEVVIHAAALKRVQTGGYSPEEMVKTNVDGTRSVLVAAGAAAVQRVVVVSSDKAVESINIYGATKYVAECLAIQANSTYWPRGTAISCVRYGNVLNSRGSVLEVWRRQLAEGLPLTITDEAMTRFIITADQAVQFVLDAAYDMQGGEVFVPVLPACTMGDLFHALVLNECGEDAAVQTLVTGPRPGGEKYHEALLNAEERAHRLRDQTTRYAVVPTHREWSAEPYAGTPVVLDRPYTSETAEERLTVGALRALIEETR